MHYLGLGLQLLITFWTFLPVMGVVLHRVQGVSGN